MIKGMNFEYKKIYFPVGEMHIQVTKKAPQSTYMIMFEFQKNEDIIELLLLNNAIRSLYAQSVMVVMPYVPFGRQDRINQDGECFSLKVFADMFNSCKFDEVIVVDPHSDVTTALLNNVSVKTQDEVFHGLFFDEGEEIDNPNEAEREKKPKIKLKKLKENFFLISPDGGALKKIYKLAKKVKAPVVECSKIRDVATGNISGVVVHAEDLEGKDCYIVDDICDGGRTFIEIAKVLKTMNAGKIILMVTHGFFTNRPTAESTGLEVFEGLIDEIYTVKGQIKPTPVKPEEVKK